MYYSSFPYLSRLIFLCKQKSCAIMVTWKKTFYESQHENKTSLFPLSVIIFAILLDVSNSHRYWIHYNSPTPFHLNKNISTLKFTLYTRVNVILIYIKIPSCMYMSKMAVFRIIREYIENENDITFSREILEHYPA